MRYFKLHYKSRNLQNRKIQNSFLDHGKQNGYPGLFESRIESRTRILGPEIGLYILTTRTVPATLKIRDYVPGSEKSKTRSWSNH